jgi:hypothetical protein
VTWRVANLKPDLQALYRKGAVIEERGYMSTTKKDRSAADFTLSRHANGWSGRHTAVIAVPPPAAARTTPQRSGRRPGKTLAQNSKTPCRPSSYDKHATGNNAAAK